MPKASKQKQDRKKNCAHCALSTKVAYRVRVPPDKDWIFLCKSCCEKATKLAGYQYGGTWKA